jgi:hypothetical protein
MTREPIFKRAWVAGHQLVRWVGSGGRHGEGSQVDLPLDV